MDYSKIISVTGLSGLFELVASKADGAVVRSLEDKNFSQNGIILSGINFNTFQVRKIMNPAAYKF